METQPSELEIAVCKADTQEHIRDVGKNINLCVRELLNRADVHDSSKLVDPELKGYSLVKTKLANYPIF